MFQKEAILFLIMNIQHVFGAPVLYNVTVSANAPQTDDKTDTTALHVLIGTICTVVATAAAVLMLYIKCRQQDGPIGSCCSMLHDLVLCKPCGLNTENMTENDRLFKRIDCPSSEILRMVLIGKSGSGKSETGNALLRRSIFRTDITASSVTQKCECKDATLFGQKVQITDTPGIFDPTANMDDTQAEIARFIDLTLPGPHILLFVLRVGRLTQEDAETLNKFKHQFGGAVENYLVVVFTHFRELKKRGTKEEVFIQSVKKSIPLLHNLKNRFVFMEHDPEYPKTDRENQLRQLLNVVERVHKENNSSCYSNDMYEARLKEIREKKKEDQRIKDEKKRKKEENINLRIQNAASAGRKEAEKEFDARLEQKVSEFKQSFVNSRNEFIKQKPELEGKGQQVQELNKFVNNISEMPIFLRSLVCKIDQKVVCGIQLTNTTKLRLSSPEIRLAPIVGGRIILKPTIELISENEVCIMLACKKTGVCGTKGLLTWNIDEKDFKIGIMWSVPFWNKPNRLAVGFPRSNDKSTHDDMYNNPEGDTHRRQEITTSEILIEKHFDGLVISGLMRSGRQTTVQVTLSTET